MQPIGRVQPPLLRDLFRREEARLALMRARWKELVGEALARRVTPIGFDGGVLRIGPEDARWERAAAEVAVPLADKLRKELPQAGVTSVEVVPVPTTRRTTRRSAKA